MDKVESNRSSACSPCITMSVLEHTPIIEISALQIIGIVEGKVWELRMGLVADAKPFYISMNDHRIRRRNRMLSQLSKNAIYLLTFFYFVRNGMKSSSKPLNNSFSFDNPNALYIEQHSRKLCFVFLYLCFSSITLFC